MADKGNNTRSNKGVYVGLQVLGIRVWSRCDFVNTFLVLKIISTAVFLLILVNKFLYSVSDIPILEFGRMGKMYF